MYKVSALLFFVITVFTLQSQPINTELKNLDNQWVNLEEYKGSEITVIDFWATWCKPCVSAIPKLNTIFQKYKDQGVSFIGVNTDGPRNLAKVKPMVNSLKIDYPVVLDTDKLLMNDLNVNVVPTLIIINNKNKNVFFHEGYIPGDEKIIEEQIIKQLSSK